MNIIEKHIKWVNEKAESGDAGWAALYVLEGLVFVAAQVACVIGACSFGSWAPLFVVGCLISVRWIWVLTERHSEDKPEERAA